MAAAAVSLSGSIVCGNSSPARAISTRRGGLDWRRTPWWASGALIFRKARRALPLAGSRADDSSAPQEMTVESALEILGLSEGASFDEIVRAKNAVLASIRDDMEAVAQVCSPFLFFQQEFSDEHWVSEFIPQLMDFDVLSPNRIISEFSRESGGNEAYVYAVNLWNYPGCFSSVQQRLTVSKCCFPSVSSLNGNVPYGFQVEAAYEMLLMQSLSRRRSGKVENSRIRYADVRTSKNTGTNALPEWLQARIKNVPVSIESPSTSNLGIQAGVYGALMLFTYVSGASTTSTGPYAGAEVSGLIIATSIGASLYFLSKKRLGLGKAAVLTVGGLVAGAAVGSAVEQWLQVDIVPFYGIHSPAIIVSEFILLSQFLVSLYLT
ncbi:hypothetical protein ZIOFF_033766 [Zingiber officinale]|uniref:Protein CHAPERONE-LIKE PROTEIN OF POR1, chloroplastic n=1 Tax=Zingiber officinale TaxID=94328 RepID=A0A8J5GK76_ZINOF|nr:hypothetical protein ZIOFF_033766 [Zingiber officinale]